ncbi:MAG TPA: ATP-binding protein [Pyrinomonadaceae bacterium]|jgi:hypothetical protein
MRHDAVAETPLVICRGNIVKAVYREPEVPDHLGNPLEEALPPMLTTDQLILRLQHFPTFHESDRNASDEVRYLLIQNSMRFFSPLDIHVDLYRRFANVIRLGYAGRNPVAGNRKSRPNPRPESFDQYSSQYKSSAAQFMSTAAGFNIAGISGVGKSFSIERILRLFPQVIHHSNYADKPFTQTQVVWLKLDCPFDGNPRGLCISFFKTVDALLGTNYRRTHAKARRIQTELLSDMATVAANHYIGVLVIDEIQRLSLAKSGGADLLLNFFVQLVNDMGVPVVLVGTYRALAVLSGEFSQLRRGTGQGDLIWDRMQKDEQWEMFVKSLFRAQYTRKSFSRDGMVEPSAADTINKQPPQPKRLSDVLYEESQGITDLAVKIYKFAQERAIDTGKEIVAASIIRSVARDKFAMLREVLTAMKQNNKGSLARWDDVYPHALKEYLAPFEGKGSGQITITGKITSEPEIQATLQSSSSTSSGLAPQSGSKANRATEPSVSPSAFTSTADTKDTDQKPASTTLPSIIESSGTSAAAYEALQQAGHIRSTSEFVP